VDIKVFFMKKFFNEKLIPYFVLLCIIVAMAFIMPRTMSFYYLSLKLNAALPLIILSLGQTMVLISGGIDLSVGGLFSVSTCILATSKLPIPMTVFTILALGIFVGAINGFAISKFNVQPFIITLASWIVLGVVALSILRTDGGAVPQTFRLLFVSKVISIPVSVFYIIGIIIIWTAIKNSPLGYSMYALGSNEYASYCNGNNIIKDKVLTYILSGTLAVCAGMTYSAHIGSGSPTVGNANTMLSIAAAVIGGTSITGGSGGAYGTIAGVFILKLINDILVFSGVSPYWTSFVQGVLLIVSVGVVAAAQILQSRKKRAISYE
jgi:ribose transport system permease protein